MRQIILDTETTGLETADGHRIIEIGAVEMVERRLTRRSFHYYINPDRLVDAEAVDVHGITNEFLRDKPRFGDLVDEFLEFVDGAEIIAHNAEFDVGFLNYELNLLDPPRGKIADIALITDSLALAKRLHPGARNSLDALCRRYEVDNSNRELHGALLDARLLAEVYLRMTGGQTALSLSVSEEGERAIHVEWDKARQRIPVVRCEGEDLAAHEKRLDALESKGACLWRSNGEAVEA